MKTALPYPPAWLDITGVCQHFPLSESSVDNYIARHSFPPARVRAGKRVWKYSEIEAWYEGETGIVPADETRVARQVYDATRKAVNAR